MILTTAGGLFAVLEHLKVGTIVIGKQAEEYENCVAFMKLAKEKHVKVVAVDLATPKISVIGVGADNKYGHPNQDVIERMESVRCKGL